ncbi:3700_t:CDS:2 [Dentiscutata heterogama]|uniref:3700_t:CDS:1 n=1 Tax=Dentiscutata heterogama TaxID=1316150 RepID=A0ACA9LSU8_9GLOM|nr:3700_t:CDS:2 [Dentiscutata heterogama]
MKFYLFELLVLIVSVFVLVNAIPAPKAPKVPKATNANQTSSSTNSTATCFQKQNGLDAEALQKKFATFTTSTPCNTGDTACINGQFAQCTNKNNWALQPCSGGLTCCALPLVNKPGTSITCDSKADQDARINAAKNAC